MNPRTVLRSLAALGAALLLTGTLAGCAAAVALEPAPEAADPGCAEIVVRLPEHLRSDIDAMRRIPIPLPKPDKTAESSRIMPIASKMRVICPSISEHYMLAGGRLSSAFFQFCFPVLAGFEC